MGWYHNHASICGDFIGVDFSTAKLLVINPDNESAWNNRGVALEKLERYEEAIATHEEALRIRKEKGD